MDEATDTIATITQAAREKKEVRRYSDDFTSKDIGSNPTEALTEAGVTTEEPTTQFDTIPAEPSDYTTQGDSDYTTQGDCIGLSCLPTTESSEDGTNDDEIVYTSEANPSDATDYSKEATEAINTIAFSTEVPTDADESYDGMTDFPTTESNEMNTEFTEVGTEEKLYSEEASEAVTEENKATEEISEAVPSEAGTRGAREVAFGDEITTEPMTTEAVETTQPMTYEADETTVTTEAAETTKSITTESVETTESASEVATESSSEGAIEGATEAASEAASEVEIEDASEDNSESSSESSME